jgi:hypothetical protein
MTSVFIQHTPIVLGGDTPPPPAAPLPTPAPVIAPFVAKAPLVLTKFQFRKLFTLTERMDIDNIASSSMSSQVKRAVTTLQKDLEVSGEVDLHLRDVYDGIYLLVSVGILSRARGDRILSNLPPL